MSTYLLVIGAIALLAGLAVWFFVRTLKGEPVGAREAGADGVNAERYQVMLRVLDPADLAYLKNNLGASKEMEGRLRRQRIRIFSTYLNELRRDFNYLQAEGRAIVASGQAPEGLAELLFEQKVRFDRNYWLVRAQLVGFRLGWMQVKPAGLVGQFEQLQAAVAPETTEA